MIKYESFKSYMVDFKEMLDLEDELNRALAHMSQDFGGYHNDLGINLFLKMIKEMTNDKDDWIEYYVFDLNWGKEYEDGLIEDKNGENIRLKSLRDLYNILLDNNEARDEE